jgi:hypothetical protein
MNRAEAITLARGAAKEHGYALTVHGTLKRDVDLVAVPWIEAASSARKLAVAIAEAVGETDCAESIRDGHTKPSRRAHGRRAFAIHVFRNSEAKDHGWYLDLSIMPRSRG